MITRCVQLNRMTIQSTTMTTNELKVLTEKSNQCDNYIIYIV